MPKRESKKKREGRYGRWGTPGLSGPYHYYPARDFTSLCGQHTSCINGGSARKKCATCRGLVDEYVDEQETKRLQADAKWRASKKRAKQVEQLNTKIDDMNRQEFEYLLSFVQSVEKERKLRDSFL